MEINGPPPQQAILKALVYDCSHDFLTEYSYKPIRVLGKGMMGQVMLAQPPAERGDRPLEAVKTFTKKSQDGGKRNYELFIQEVAILQSIEHKYIMGNVEAFECQDEYTICMPYYKEGNLKSHLSRLTIDLTDKYLLQLNSAVLYLHSRRLVHRDIKPQNVLISDDGNVILADFGLACAVDSKSKYCRRLCGTRGYMASELERSPLPENIDLYKCDMYSLGVVLCNMIFGRAKAPDGTDFLTFLRFQPYIPAFYKDIVENLLREDSSVRWNSQMLMNFMSTSPSMANLLKTLDG